MGLGNYDMPKTRHSVGMIVTDSIAELLALQWERKRSMSCFTAHKSLPGLDVVLLKSKLAMNLSGRSVSKAG